MDTRTLSQPRLAFTDEVSVNDKSHDSRKRSMINDHLWFVDDDGSRVVFFRHEAIYQADLEDKQHLRFIAVSLRLNGHATQSEIAQAFGHTVRTQRDWETQYQKEGFAGAATQSRLWTPLTTPNGPRRPVAKMVRTRCHAKGHGRTSRCRR